MKNGFSYNGIHSSVYGAYLKSKDRSLMPSLRKRELTIPGRHGVYSFDDETFAKRMISIEINYLGDDYPDMRYTARDISAWLNGANGYRELIFDDEPDKYYSAKICSAVGLANIHTIGTAQIQFECQPHALLVVTSAEDVFLDDDLPLDMDLILDSGDDYTISL